MQHRLVALIASILTAVMGAAAVAEASTTGSITAAYGYDGPPIARIGTHETGAVDALLSEAWEESVSPPAAADATATTPDARSSATNTADDIARAITRPSGVADDWVSEVALSGKGAVWRAPGTSGNAGTVRIMEPTAQYPNGYVRFYNQHGQPIGLNGNPGPNSVTHIPLNPDGTYSLPKGWGGAG